MKLLLKMDGRAASGGTPLLMHNERLADPLDPMQQALAAVSGKRKKELLDHEEMARIEFFGGAYTTPEIPDLASVDGQLIAVPGWNIVACLEQGAKSFKRGRDVLRGVVPLDEYTTFSYEGPTAVSEAWAGGYFLRKGVKINGRRITRTRPALPEWNASLNIEANNAVFDLPTLRRIWEHTGLQVALGDRRPIYGRFKGTIEEVK